MKRLMYRSTKSDGKWRLDNELKTLRNKRNTLYSKCLWLSWSVYTQVTQRCSGFLESFFHYLTIDFFTSEATMMQFCPSLKNSLRSGPSEIFFNTQNSQLKKGCFSGQTHKCNFFILKLLWTCLWYKCLWWSERCVTC